MIKEDLKACHANLSAFRILWLYHWILRRKYDLDNIIEEQNFCLTDTNNNNLIATNNQNTMVMCLSTAQVQSYE